MPEAEAIRVAIVGDVAIDRPDPTTTFAPAADLLASCDIRFGNCEAVYTTREERNPAATGVIRSDPSNFQALMNAGFDAMGFANNHALDLGYGGFFDTLELLSTNGILPVGAGRDADMAWAPVVIERRGVRVAFVCCTCVYPPGYGAGAGKPGCAVVEVVTSYVGETGQPGTAPEVSTFVHPDSMARVRTAIDLARGQAEIVMFSVHGGLHNERATLADYERELAHAAIDYGAHIVFGHHQHILKGFEVYSGRPIFYGLGCFAVDLHIDKVVRPERLAAIARRYGEYGIRHRPDYPSYPFHPEARQTVLLEVAASRNGIELVRLHPCLINSSGQPVPLESDSADFEQCVQYLIAVSKEAGLPASYPAMMRNQLLLVLPGR